MDSRCASIMQGTLVPSFKRGDYSGGIVTGVEQLGRMATQSPFDHPPGDFLEEHVRPMTQYSALNPKPFLVAIGIGFAFIILGIWWPTYRWRLIFTGVAIILVTVLTWMLLLIALALARSGRGGSGSGSSRPARGMSGGYSGGGGASGSW